MDYKKLGLKCGLEIHQQLDTKKLFCRTPSLLRDDKPDLKVIRTLHAVAGESGKIDVAAKEEQNKKRTFVYEGYNDTTSLVEFDEEPPQEMDKDALKAALEAALLFKTNVVDFIQVMRKTVVDGSNTSGFQRTALIAQNGSISTDEGDISIQTVCIEEDSARKIGEQDNRVIYRLDRLGIPLIEVATGPDIKTPEGCMKAAEKMGMILRSTGKVKRGLGTIRQDVNVSIKGGARVEIKGAQDLKSVPQLVKNEIVRQINLIEIREELQKRKARIEEKYTDLTDVLKNADSKLVKSVIKNSGVVLGMKLSGFAELIGKEVQEGRRLGTEFSDRAKVKAGVGGLFHSDELPKYGITEDFVKEVQKKLGCKKQDGFILVAAKKEKAQKALHAVFGRASEAMTLIPKEVRKARADATTSYLRPIPGAARMYPETDIPLIKPDISKIALPELISDKKERFVKKFKLGNDLAMFIAKSKKSNLFEEIAKKYKSVKPAFIAETLTATLIELKRDHNVEIENIHDEDIEKLFSYIDKKKISKDVMTKALIDLSKETFDLKNYQSVKKSDLKKEVSAIVESNKGAPFGALMGMCMKKLAGKASGKEISDMLKKLVQK